MSERLPTGLELRPGCPLPSLAQPEASAPLLTHGRTRGEVMESAEGI